jgi:hypothetical protein
MEPELDLSWLRSLVVVVVVSYSSHLRRLIVLDARNVAFYFIDAVDEYR